MISVDVRSRTAAHVVDVDPPEFFFAVTLPKLIAERSGLAAPGARELGIEPFGFEVEGRSWTVSFDGDDFSIDPGLDGAKAAVRLDRQGLSDLVNDIRTPMGFFTGGDLDMPLGRLDQFLDWGVVLRSLLDGQPLHTAGSVDFTEPNGRPLDFTRAFHLDDDPDEMAEFLGTAGFLHLAEVFDPDEMAAVSADMDEAAGRYSRGDDRSWWARTRDGEDRLVRMQYFHEESAATADLMADDRLLSIGRLTSDDHMLGKFGGNQNQIEALVKPIGIVEGISDVPWHKDCSLGSHSYRCCSLTVGISVTGAEAGSGQLRVVAGSHRTLIQPAFVRKGLDLPQVDLPTGTGDVTVHLSCTLHMSQPPTTRERRVMYTDFTLPPRNGELDPGEATIRRIRKNAGANVSQPPA